MSSTGDEVLVMEHLPHTPSPNDGERPEQIVRLELPGHDVWTESIKLAGRAIQHGIREAAEAGREIDDQTAVLIAQVLSIALRLDRLLWDFDPNGPIDYDGIRNRYLTLYNDPETPEHVRYWIDWFGTYLLHRTGETERSTGLDGVHAPRLSRTLVPHEFAVNGFAPVQGQIPASLSSDEVHEAEQRLWDQDLARTPAFRAFLTMPGVDATDPTIIQRFHKHFEGAYASTLDALYGISRAPEWEHELEAWAKDKGLPVRIARLDLSVLRGLVTSAFDLVEFDARVYAFSK